MSDAQLPASQAMQVILITGVSGSGKSVAIAALEDAGYYCVDNLPAQLLVNLVHLQQAQGVAKMAVATDVRSATSLPQLIPHIEQLRLEGISVQIVFLDASTDALVHRFSETRRAHPLSTETSKSPGLDLMQAIETERDLLSR
ncbi:MAG: nucleotide-binding protein, partial [Pseudomonadota bacterium]